MILLKFAIYPIVFAVFSLLSFESLFISDYTLLALYAVIVPLCIGYAFGWLDYAFFVLSFGLIFYLIYRSRKLQAAYSAFRISQYFMKGGLDIKLRGEK